MEEELSSIGFDVHIVSAGDGDIVPFADGTTALLNRVVDTDLSVISQAINSVVGAVRRGMKHEIAPDTVSVSFGLRVTGEAGVVISRVGGEASLTIELTWNKATE